MDASKWTRVVLTLLAFVVVATGTVLGVAATSPENLLPQAGYEFVFSWHNLVVLTPLCLVGQSTRRSLAVLCVSIVMIAAGLCLLMSNVEHAPMMMLFVGGCVVGVGNAGIAVSIGLEKPSSSTAVRICGVGLVSLGWFVCAVMPGVSWLGATPWVVGAAAYLSMFPRSAELTVPLLILLALAPMGVEANLLPGWSVYLTFLATLAVAGTARRMPTWWETLCLVVQGVLLLEAVALLAFVSRQDDLYVHDTLFRSAWVHLAIFAAAARWLFTLKPRSTKRAGAALALILVGAHVLVLGHLMLGRGGMPRAYFQYVDMFASWHLVSGFAGPLFCVGVLWLWSTSRPMAEEQEPAVF